MHNMRNRIRTYSETVAAVGGVVDFVDEIVPSNQTYVIKSVGVDLDNVAGWTFCHWRFLKNGIPVYPLDDIYDQIGYAAQRQSVENIQFPGGSRFQIRGINDHAALNIGMLITVEYDIVDND